MILCQLLSWFTARGMMVLVVYFPVSRAGSLSNVNCARVSELDFESENKVVN
jgi:hypothetical protein